MKKLVTMLLLVVMLVGCLSGCGGKQEAAPEAAAPAAESNGEETAAAVALPGEGETYCVIMSLGQLEFFDALKGGVCDAANEIGAKWYFAGPQEFVPDQIVQAIDQAVANKVTGIVLHGQTEETANAIDNAIAAGIPVICVNTDIPSDRLSFIGCDPYNAGVGQAEELLRLLDGKTGTVIISSALAVAQPSAIANLEGAHSVLDSAPGIKVVEVDDTADSNVAATNIGAALQANPDVVGIIGQQAYTAVGAATAVREAGKTGEIVIVGRDRDTATLDLIRDGEVAASFAQNSYVEGYIALQWLHAYVNDNLKVIEGYRDLGVNPLPDAVDSGSIIINETNQEQFRAKYEYEVTASN